MKIELCRPIYTAHAHPIDDGKFQYHSEFGINTAFSRTCINQCWVNLFGDIGRNVLQIHAEIDIKTNSDRNCRPELDKMRLTLVGRETALHIKQMRVCRVPMRVTKLGLR